jgi:lipopolysaccharide transport system ATP-binding protein
LNDAVIVEGVGKSFRLPLDKPATLKYRVTHPRSSSRSREFHALHDITFTVPRGQFLGIIGHNGSGKSTLLKILSGIYVPDRGRLQVDGRVSPFLELGVGFNPELTARDNVYLNGAVLGLTRRHLDDIVDDIIAFAEVSEFAEQKLKNFSAGMQARLAFSVAIRANAEILLMDEVLAVGDARFAEKCFDVFARYKRDGRTIILVTHDLGSVQQFCDRALLLDHGRLLGDDLPTAVIGKYRRMVGEQSDQASGVDDPSASAQPTSNRWGTREVSILGARMVRADGTVHHTFIAGETVTIEIDYEVHDDSASQMVCGIGFSRSDGLSISGPNTLTAGHPLACPPKRSRGRIRYALDELRLLAGAYVAAVALYDPQGTHVFDHIDNLLSFRVVDEEGRFGIVELGGRWESEVIEVATPLALEGEPLVHARLQR